MLFIRADQMFLELKQSRADYSHEKALRRFLAPDLLILDDFALRRLDTTQSNDIYEVVIERHRRSSTILTSNRLCAAAHNRFNAESIFMRSLFQRVAAEKRFTNFRSA